MNLKPLAESQPDSGLLPRVARNEQPRATAAPGALRTGPERGIYAAGAWKENEATGLTETLAGNQTPLRRERRAPARPVHSPAFTLLELILVMAILIVVLAVSSPSLANFFRGRTLDSEARRFLALTHHAQSRAVSEGIPVQLWIDDQTRTYGLRADPGYTPDDPKAIQFEIAPDLQVEITATATTTTTRTTSRTPAASNNNNNNSTTTLRFQPDGALPSGSAPSIRFRGANDTTLTLAPGRSRLNYEIQSDTQR